MTPSKRIEFAPFMQMKKRISVLIASVAVAGCTSTSDRLTDTQMAVAESAVSHVLAELPPGRSIAVCFPDRTDAKAEFDSESGLNRSNVSACPFWRNKLLRQSQWELDVASVSVEEAKALVEIFVTDSDGDHAGRYLFDYERSPDGWKLLRKSFGVA